MMRYANIKWIETIYPYSLDFNDPYFSSCGAVEEKSYVFLEQNGLPIAWRKKELFVIGECGFGFGLNFLLTLKMWRDDSYRCKELIFFSCDNLPVSLDDLKRLYGSLPHLKPLAEELVEFYKTLKAGVNKFYLGKVLLVLVISDAIAAMENFDRNVDVWFFDGFSPLSNVSAWSDEVIKKAAAKSNLGASFSTYTVSGMVKRSLIHSGFKVEKVKGFAKKREMLKGIYIDQTKLT